MNTTYGETDLGQFAPTERFSSFVKRHWDAFQEQRKRERLRGLNDRELKDIGISLGEIDYLAPKSYLEP